ncbi:unnamed protein product, partial [Didymodactylos carnosus]
SPQGGHVLEVYDAMLELQKTGKIKSVGVSNFGVKHLEWLINADRPLPVVNQIELHPWWPNEDIVDYCRKKNIAIIAYSPLAKARAVNETFVQNLAKKYHKTPAQILLRWSIQNGFITIPKTSNTERLKENMNIFDFALESDDMKALLEYGKMHAANTNWDPTTNSEVDFGPMDRIHTEM